MRGREGGREAGGLPPVPVPRNHCSIPRVAFRADGSFSSTTSERTGALAEVTELTDIDQGKMAGFPHSRIVHRSNPKAASIHYFRQESRVTTESLQSLQTF